MCICHYPVSELINTPIANFGRSSYQVFVITSRMNKWEHTTYGNECIHNPR